MWFFGHKKCCLHRILAKGDTAAVDPGRAFKIGLLTFVISLFISYTFQFSLNFWVSAIILLIVLFTGILFDVVGTSVTAASEVPFHAMAADKVKGSKQAIYLIRHADKVANICNDVVGDICGTVSGALVVSISVVLIRNIAFLPEGLIGAASIAFIAALTVGGKALGKSFAISQADRIVFSVGKILYLFKFSGFTPPRKNKRRTGTNARKVRKV